MLEYFKDWRAWEQTLAIFGLIYLLALAQADKAANARMPKLIFSLVTFFGHSHDFDPLPTGSGRSKRGQTLTEHRHSQGNL